MQTTILWAHLIEDYLAQKLLMLPYDYMIDLHDDIKHSTQTPQSNQKLKAQSVDFSSSLITNVVIVTIIDTTFKIQHIFYR